MDFIGTGKRLSPNDIGDAARLLGIETAVLLAFIEVEAAGRGFDSLNRPKMLFEPHVFYRNLAGAVRAAAVKAGLAYAKWKSGNYPADSYPRLKSAISIAREPGFRSASYGLPQILGENHRAAGFSSAELMVKAMMQGEREQLLAMVTLLKDWGLAAVLRGRDFTNPDSWRDAASRYNGSSYATHGYHTKLAAAYVKHSKGTPMQPPASNVRVLQNGMKGEDVRNVQADLQALGYVFELGVDGRFGDETERHVRNFQRARGIGVDGRVGQDTLKHIAIALARAGEDKTPPTPVWPGKEGESKAPENIAVVVILGIIAAIIGIVGWFFTQGN